MDHAPDKGLAWELTKYKLGVQTLYLRAGHDGPELYKRAGIAEDVEEMVEHDGPVIIDGEFGEVVDDDGIPTFYHPDGGRMVGPSLTELGDSPALRLCSVPQEGEP